MCALCRNLQPRFVSSMEPLYLEWSWLVQVRGRHPHPHLYQLLLLCFVTGMSQLSAQSMKQRRVQRQRLREGWRPPSMTANALQCCHVTYMLHELSPKTIYYTPVPLLQVYCVADRNTSQISSTQSSRRSYGETKGSITSSLALNALLLLHAINLSSCFASSKKLESAY